MVNSKDGGYLRRTIGFRSEIVEDREDHDTFPVTGGSFVAPATQPVRAWEDFTARKRGGKR